MDDFCMAAMQIATVRLCQAQGFTSSNSLALSTLQEVAKRFLIKLARVTVLYASHRNDPDPDIFDASAALVELGVNLEELFVYAKLQGSAAAYPFHIIAFPALPPFPRGVSPSASSTTGLLQLTAPKDTDTELITRPEWMHDFLPSTRCCTSSDEEEEDATLVAGVDAADAAGNVADEDSKHLHNLPPEAAPSRYAYYAAVSMTAEGIPTARQTRLPGILPDPRPPPQTFRSRPRPRPRRKPLDPTISTNMRREHLLLARAAELNNDYAGSDTAGALNESDMLSNASSDNDAPASPVTLNTAAVVVPAAQASIQKSSGAARNKVGPSGVRRRGPVAKHKANTMFDLDATLSETISHVIHEFQASEVSALSTPTQRTSDPWHFSEDIEKDFISSVKFPSSSRQAARRMSSIADIHPLTPTWETTPLSLRQEQPLPPCTNTESSAVVSTKSSSFPLDLISPCVSITRLDSKESLRLQISVPLSDFESNDCAIVKNAAESPSSATNAKSIGTSRPLHKKVAPGGRSPKGDVGRLKRAKELKRKALEAKVPKLLLKLPFSPTTMTTTRTEELSVNRASQPAEASPPLVMSIGGLLKKRRRAAEKRERRREEKEARRRRHRAHHNKHDNLNGMSSAHLILDDKLSSPCIMSVNDNDLAVNNNTSTLTTVVDDETPLSPSNKVRIKIKLGSRPKSMSVEQINEPESESSSGLNHSFLKDGAANVGLLQQDSESTFYHIRDKEKTEYPPNLQPPPLAATAIGAPIKLKINRVVGSVGGFAAEQVTQRDRSPPPLEPALGPPILSPSGSVSPATEPQQSPVSSPQLQSFQSPTQSPFSPLLPRAAFPTRLTENDSVEALHLSIASPSISSTWNLKHSPAPRSGTTQRGRKRGVGSGRGRGRASKSNMSSTLVHTADSVEIVSSGDVQISDLPPEEGSLEELSPSPALPSLSVAGSFYYNEEGVQVWICPTCLEQDDGSLMVGCDNCDDWYHAVCLGMVTAPPEDEKWFCPRCRGEPVSRAQVSNSSTFRARHGAPPGVVKRKHKVKKRK